jgi:hypothetical protein
MKQTTLSSSGKKIKTYIGSRRKKMEEAPFSLPEPNRFILNVGFFFIEEAANNLSVSGF